MVLLALPPADHRLIERDRGNCAFSATPHDGQRPCRGLAEDSRQHPAELRIRGPAAQTRVVSMAGIRLGSWESARAFKGIICHDISEFESHMPSHAVRSPSAKMRVVPTFWPLRQGLRTRPVAPPSQQRSNVESRGSGRLRCNCIRKVWPTRKEVPLCLTGTVSKICWRFCTGTLQRRLTRSHSIAGALSM